MAAFGGDDNDFSNPFADPSVKQAKGTTDQNVLLEFNPFSENNKASTTGPSNVVTSTPFSSQPAVLQTNNPPAYTPTPAQRINTDDLDRRQKELENRAREIDRKDELLRQQQQREIQEQQDGSKSRLDKSNNWPLLPSICPIRPCFYHDIDVDIAPQFRRYVRIGYYLWWAHAVLLFINIGGTMASFIVGTNSNAGATFGVSLLIFVIMTPCSFVCWYRPLYKAFRSDSSFNFFVFFIMMLAQFVIFILQCLGLDMLGSSGWINGLSAIGINRGAGAFMLVIAALFTVLAIFDVMFLIRVHRLYRSTGASLEKAKAEFRTGVTKNETVRNAVIDLGSSAAQGAVSGATRK